MVRYSFSQASESEPAKLFEFDVVLLLDPDPRGFPGGFAERLVKPGAAWRSVWTASST